MHDAQEIRGKIRNGAELHGLSPSAAWMFSEASVSVENLFKTKRFKFKV